MGYNRDICQMKTGQYNLMKRIFILHLYLIAVIPSYAQKHTAIHDHKEKIQRWLTENNVPCAAVGIVENGKIKMARVFGYTGKNVPAANNTLFNIASMTKPVVAVLTLQLVQSGQWDLEEPLSKYWIDPDIANEPWTKRITTRHVLTHQTGFPNWRGNAKLRFDFEPGTKSQYSGEGFEYLKTALEKKFGIPLEKLLDSLLFKPLGMKDTRYWGKDMDMQRFARWHDALGKEYKVSYERGVSAADDLVTTAADYCRFMIFVMNGAGLSKSLYADMINPQVKLREHTGRGLSWEVIRDLPAGEYALAHGGGDVGVKTMGICLPVSKRSIVVFTNGDNGTAVHDNIIREFIDIGEKIIDYSNGAYKGTVITLDNSMLDKYTGRYQRSDADKTLTITRQGNALKLTGDGVPMMTLLPEADNRFFAKGSPYQFEFVSESNEQSMILRVLDSGNLLLTANRIK
jgi:CubicO group peptidase (beta-lactamase class C family)